MMECGSCTLCCKLLDVPWTNSAAGEWCPECEPGVGCKVWDKAPDECKEFACAYSQMERCSIDMRPDKCKVIFDRIDGDIFLGTVDPHYPKVKKAVEKQVKAFHRQGFSVVLSIKGRPPHIIASKATTPKKVYEKIRELHGRAILHN